MSHPGHPVIKAGHSGGITWLTYFITRSINIKVISYLFILLRPYDIALNSVALVYLEITPRGYLDILFKSGMYLNKQ